MQGFFYNIINIAVINSHVIFYKNITGSNISRLVFIQNIYKDITGFQPLKTDQASGTITLEGEKKQKKVIWANLNAKIKQQIYVMDEITQFVEHVQ